MSPSRATVTNIPTQPPAPSPQPLLALDDGVALFDPLVPAAAQRAHALHAARLKHERRTGARGLVPSGTVHDDRLSGLLQDRDGFLVRIEPREPAFERQRQRAAHVTLVERFDVA